MGEVDAVPRGQVHVGDWNVDAFDLAEGIPELQLGHVLARGQLRPAGWRDDLVQLEGRAAAGAAQLIRVDDGGAPGTLCGGGRLRRDRDRREAHAARFT